MANVESEFENVDYDIVRILAYTSGVERLRLNQGQTNRLKGPEGESFQFAWKARDELITDDEMQTFGTEAMYGESFSFGNPRGQIP